MSISFNVSGLSKLSQNLDKLNKRAQGKAKVKALRSGGKVILKEAKRRVHKDTGTLSKSLGITVHKSGGEKQLLVLARKGKSRKYDGWYAHLEEFGTVKTPAHPFLGPAAEDKAPEAIKEIGQTLATEILKGLS